MLGVKVNTSLLTTYYLGRQKSKDMNIPKAIRVNTVLKKAPVLEDDPVVIEALNLNIEALKRCKVLAENSPFWAAKPLPGETED